MGTYDGKFNCYQCPALRVPRYNYAKLESETWFPSLTKDSALEDWAHAADCWPKPCSRSHAWGCGCAKVNDLQQDHQGAGWLALQKGQYFLVIVGTLSVKLEQLWLYTGGRDEYSHAPKIQTLEIRNACKGASKSLDPGHSYIVAPEPQHRTIWTVRKKLKAKSNSYRQLSCGTRNLKLVNAHQDGVRSI
jgi:hypothetical protein